MPFPFHFLAFIGGMETPEMIMIFVVILVLFGGQKLPEFARGLGKSIKEFKKAAAGVEEEFKRAIEEDEIAKSTPKTLPAPATQAALPAPNVPVVTELLAINDSAPAIVEPSTAAPGEEIPSSGGETAPDAPLSSSGSPPPAPAPVSRATPTSPSTGPRYGKSDV